MRDTPTSVAPPYISGPMTHVDFGHQSVVSSVTAAAAAKAVVECPDGNERYRLVAKPLPKWKSSGSSIVTNGRERPSAPLITYDVSSPSSTASVPCQPRSAMRG